MVESKLSFCSFRCDLCLAYHANIEAHPENRLILSDGWHTYIGFRIPPDKIICDGCTTEGKPTLDVDCPVRPCNIDRKLENCAYCEDFVCEKINERLANFDDIQQHFNQAIPEKDRERFILPYENMDRLKTLRNKK